MNDLRALDIWLLEEDKLRLRVTAETSDRHVRPNVLEQVQWRTLSGDARVDALGNVSGRGLLEARVGDIAERVAVAREGAVLSMLTTMDFSRAWEPGRESAVFGHIQRSDVELRDEKVALRCADPAVARVHGQTLHPIAPGAATVQLEWAGLLYESTLRVVDAPIRELAIRVPYDNTDCADGPKQIALNTALDFSVCTDGAQYRQLDLLEYVKVEISSPAVRLVQQHFGWQLKPEETGRARVTARAGGQEAHLDVFVYDPADVEITY